MGLQILKDSKLKAVLSQHSGRQQSAKEARERLDALVTELLVKIAKAAGKSAEEQNLTRIMPANVEAGFNSVLNQSNLAPNPSQFLQALHDMDIEDVGEVLRLISDWTHEALEEGKEQRKR